METMPEIAEKVAEVTPEVVPEVKSEPDLLERVAQFQDEQKPVEVENDFKFDVNEINTIQDPNARKYAEDAYKSFQKGFNTKFQELAELRKSLESSIAKGQEPSTWTTEKVQSLLNDKSFVEAAQSVASVPETDEYSALSDVEKAKLGAMEKELLHLKSLNNQTLKQAQDEALKSKYANYDPIQIDTLTSDLINGKVQATREHLYKIANYETNVRRAYELGLKDKQQGITEKVDQISVDGIAAVANEATPIKEEKESNESFFSRLAMKNLAKHAAQQQRR